MPIYKIAEIPILINPVTPQTERRLLPYLSDSAEFEFDASVSMEEIEEYTAKSKTPCLPYLAEDALVLTKISREVLSSYNGCFFHSSCLELDGEGYLFTALSGTGKSTHTANCRYYVCSTPWMGKSDIGCNMISPIKAVYVLKRGKENTAAASTPAKQIRQLMEATLLPDSKENMVRLLTLFDDLFLHVKLIELYCTPGIESARVAYEAAQD